MRWPCQGHQGTGEMDLLMDTTRGLSCVIQERCLEQLRCNGSNSFEATARFMRMKQSLACVTTEQLVRGLCKRPTVLTTSQAVPGLHWHPFTRGLCKLALGQAGVYLEEVALAPIHSRSLQGRKGPSGV